MTQIIQIRPNKSYQALENSKLVTSLKNVPKFKDDFSEKVDQSREKSRQEKFQNKKYQKDTKSTLMESFKSNNSLT